jgi:hypothetical protein
MARRAWLTASQVLGTRTVAGLLGAMR